MKNTIELIIDALFSVTDLDAYEHYNLNPKKEMKDITYFKKQIYEGDIIKLSQGQDGFTIITIEEDGIKKDVRVLETIEEIQVIMEKMEILRKDEEILNFLTKKIDDLDKKNQKKIGILKK